MLYNILFFAIPTLLIALWAVSLVRFVSAKRKISAASGTISPEELKRRKLIFIILSVLAGAFTVIVIGFVLLLFLAVAFM